VCPETTSPSRHLLLIAAGRGHIPSCHTLATGGLPRQTASDDPAHEAHTGSTQRAYGSPSSTWLNGWVKPDRLSAGIRANRRFDLVLKASPLLDTLMRYELLACCDTLGVFQLDGDPMLAVLHSMVPDSFEDICAAPAPYRPGPIGASAHDDYADRKNKRQPVGTDPLPLAEPFADMLDETFGPSSTSNRS
jgi:hypothetical protein